MPHTGWNGHNPSGLPRGLSVIKAVADAPPGARQALKVASTAGSAQRWPKGGPTLTSRSKLPSTAAERIFSQYSTCVTRMRSVRSSPGATTACAIQQQTPSNTDCQHSKLRGCMLRSCCACGWCMSKGCHGVTVCSVSLKIASRSSRSECSGMLLPATHTYSSMCESALTCVACKDCHLICC